MLQVHRAERADELAESLARLLREPVADPFVAEVVSVPAKGVERWLAQRLSHRLGTGGRDDGICANVVFPAVSAVVGESVAAAGGSGRPDDPWQPARLVWTLLDVIDGCAGQDWCGALGGYLGVSDGDQIRRGRRYATARHLAELFDSYGRHRPDMVTAWSRGVDLDGVGGFLPDDLRWQAELWRRLRQRLAVPSPAERLPEICRVLREHPERLALPPRLSIFGLTRLPNLHIAVLAALAERREVHLWLAHPSPALWDRVRPDAVARGPLARRTDPTRQVPRHPLLSSLGRDARELQLALAAAGAPTADHHHPCAAAPDTLLGRIQGALAGDDPPEGTGRPLLHPADPQRAGARLPRCRPSGGGAARGRPRPARRAAGPAGARRAGDVSGHRDVRPADHRVVRPGRGGARASGPPDPGAARRPGTAAGQPAARGGRPVAGAGRLPADSGTAARLRGGGAGAPPVPVRRR